MMPEEKNPQGFKVGERVIVSGEGHPQFGKTGKIYEFFGVNIEHGKPRCSIQLDPEHEGGNSAGFIFVSLPNLTREAKDQKGEEKKNGNPNQQRRKRHG